MLPRCLTQQGKRSTSSADPKSFQFIDLSNDAQKAGEDDRSIIREVAMSDYHRRKRQRAESPVEELVPPLGSVTISDTLEQRMKVFQLSQVRQGPHEVVMSDYHRRKRKRTDLSVDQLVPVLGSATISPLEQRTKVFRLTPRQGASAASKSKIVSTRTKTHEESSIRLLNDFEFEEYVPDTLNSSRRSRIPQQLSKRKGLHDKPKACKKGQYGTGREVARAMESTLELSGGILEPLINLPSASSPRIRRLVHHYCEPAVYLKTLMKHWM